MTEKRYMVSINTITSEREFWDYDKHLDPCEVVKILNNYNKQNKQLKKENKQLKTKLHKTRKKLLHTTKIKKKNNQIKYPQITKIQKKTKVMI